VQGQGRAQPLRCRSQRAASGRTAARAAARRRRAARARPRSATPCAGAMPRPAEPCPAPKYHFLGSITVKQRPIEQQHLQSSRLIMRECRREPMAASNVGAQPNVPLFAALTQQAGASRPGSRLRPGHCGRGAPCASWAASMRPRPRRPAVRSASAAPSAPAPAPTAGRRRRRRHWRPPAAAAAAAGRRGARARCHWCC